MNKQAVIEILEEELGKIKDTGLPTSSGKELLAWNAAGMARHIYARIAKEFSEEEFNKAMLSRLFVAKTDCGHEVKGLKKLREDAKHLWEDTEEGTIERRKRKRREKPCPIGRRRWKTSPDGSLSTLERRRQ